MEYTGFGVPKAVMLLAGVIEERLRDGIATLKD
jgi:hypothetical protein